MPTPIPAGHITAGEAAVLALLAAGRTTVEAAVVLGLSATAVTSRLDYARRRTGTRTTPQLLVHAIATGQLALASAPPADDAPTRVEAALLALSHRQGPGALLDLADRDDRAVVVAAVLPAIAPPTLTTTTKD